MADDERALVKANDGLAPNETRSDPSERSFTTCTLSRSSFHRPRSGRLSIPNFTPNMRQGS